MIPATAGARQAHGRFKFRALGLGQAVPAPSTVAAGPAWGRWTAAASAARRASGASRHSHGDSESESQSRVTDPSHGSESRIRGASHSSRHGEIDSPCGWPESRQQPRPLWQSLPPSPFTPPRARRRTGPRGPIRADARTRPRIVRRMLAWCTPTPALAYVPGLHARRTRTRSPQAVPSQVTRRSAVPPSHLRTSSRPALHALLQGLHSIIRPSLPDSDAARRAAAGPVCAREPGAQMQSLWVGRRPSSAKRYDLMVIPLAIPKG